MSTSLSLIDPHGDPEFALECAEARKEVLRWWQLLQEFLAARPRTKAMVEKSRATGIPFKTLERKFIDWRKAGHDWRTLVNRAKWPEPKSSTLSPAFRAFYVDLYEHNQRDRSGSVTHAILLARLTAWERDPLNPDLAIPGYDLPPKRNPYTHLPDSWSQATLTRLLKAESNVYQRTLRRQGPKAASVYLPKIHTTREGLAFGQIVYHDDSDHDVYVNLSGRNSKAMRPLSFNSLEALSGSHQLLSLKPQLENLSGDGRQQLNQLDFFWHLMLHLTSIGYNAKSGTVHIMEHGTTNIDKAANFDETIRRVTNDKVIIDRSGRFGNPAFKEMLFEGQPSGNFRFKAPIESFFQNVRNYSGFLPGPTGLNRENSPEESYGLLMRNDGIQRLIDKISPDTFMRLRRPILEWEDYTRLCRAIHQIINQRTDHHLQGFHKLGFTKHSYRLSLDSPWIGEREYQLIPAHLRAAYDHIVAQEGYFRSELLSPEEVDRRHRHVLTRLPLHIVPILAPPRAWETVTVSKSLEIEMTDQEIDSEPLRYLAKLRPVKGEGTITLERGKSYKCLLNPFAPDHLFIADKEGSYMGTATRLHEPGKLDYEAVVQQLGALNTIRADENVEVHSRMSSEAAQRVEDYHFNKHLRGGQLATAEEKEAARLDRSAARFGDLIRNQQSEVSDDLSDPVPEEDWSEPLTPVTAVEPVETAQPNEPEIW